MRQGQDDIPHLTYYDRTHSLSFVWDGNEGLWIDVSYGGYGEPVIARFPWDIRLTGPVPGNVTTDVVAAFGRACEAFINLIHQIEDTQIGGHR